MANWYVNASAGPGGDGSSGSPWNTFAAVAQASISAGDVVWVSSGTYDEKFTVTKGGTSAAARITYIGTGATKPIIRGVAGGAVGYVALLNFQFTQASTSYAYPAFRLDGATGWLLQDNYFYQTYQTAIDLHFGTNNIYNVIRGNTFDQIGHFTGYEDGANLIQCYGSYNLIECNTFKTGNDRVYIISDHSIVRNNYDFGNQQAGEFHTDQVQAGKGGAYNSAYLFVTANWLADNRGSDAHNFLIQDSGGSGVVTNEVIRQNVCLRTGSAFLSAFQGTNKVRVYNNTVAYARSDATNLNGATVSFAAPASDDISIINTAWYNTNCAAGWNVIASTNTTNFSADYNAVSGNGVLTGFGTHNVTADPLFVNPGADNYTLQSGSPLRNVATAVTTADGDGVNSTALTVIDATGLCDGFGIADGDWIKIGSGEYVQISNVDYPTNVVTLANTRSWTSGDAVVVRGTGDISALPFNAAGYVYGGTLFLSSLTVTVPDSSIIRCVIPKISGIPQAPVYTTTGSNNYTMPAGTTSADIFPLYASTTPVIAATVDSGAIPGNRYGRFRVTKIV